MANDDPNQLSPNKQALLRIRELKRQLAAAENRSPQAGPIAIVSMACRFPQRSRTPEEFWQCLLEGRDEVSEVPEDRWDRDAFFDEDPEVPGKMYVQKGVFLDQIDQMDPEFFGISPREATWVDPQQRLLLEVGWEALERAAWLPGKIGGETGIFVGWMHNDYQNEASDSFLNLNPYIATGAAGSFLCGRLAYSLGLQGPSVAVDTACSSSLVALHLACQSLQRGDCGRALVGGVNVICSPTTNILTCKLKALSPHGHSRAFDAAADGYLRGEGCAVVALRRLEDAERDGDTILGIIRGSAVGHNGFSGGLTAPNPRAQEKIIRQALQQAMIAPSDVAYLEAHGTGTELGDPIELQAAAAALASNRTADEPLLVGSVKTNIGHLEAAAGMAGLIKVLLAMQYDCIPGQLNFETPNPHIPWDDKPLKVVTEPTQWPARDRRIAGVSAFGMSGTNAHVVIEAGQPAKPASPSVAQRNTAEITGETTADEPQLLVLSGRNESALRALAEGFQQHLTDQTRGSLADTAYTSGACRSHFEHRAALVISERSAAIEGCGALARGGRATSVFEGQGRRPPKVAWQFTGQGSQYVGMARGLYESVPEFRETIDRCTRQLAEWREGSLLDVLFDEDGRIDDTTWAQPAIFSIQMGLVRLLEDLGLAPDVVLGHSVGQYAAACVAGLMTWEQGLRLISERGRLIGSLPAGGCMVAVFAAPTSVQDAIADLPGLSVAALNGTHTVVSGPAGEIEDLTALLKERGLRSRRLTTSHAFHSALMDPALEPFAAFADTIEFQPGRIPLVCNVSGEVMDAQQRLDGAYWAEHIRKPVRFAESIDAVQNAGCELILELGPQAVLTRMAAGTWTGQPDRLISCLQRDGKDRESFLAAVGQLYVHGCEPDFEALHKGREVHRVRLPTYPFQRRRFWGPDKPRAAHAEFHTAHPLLGTKINLAGSTSETRFESHIDIDSPAWLPDHEVMGQVVVPGAAWIETVIAAASGAAIGELNFEQPLRPTGRTTLQTVIRSDETGRKTIEGWSVAATGAAWQRHYSASVDDKEHPRPDRQDLAALQSSCSESVDPAEFYGRMSDAGLNYGAAFRTIQSLHHSDAGVLTLLKSGGDVRGFTVPPPILDGALHSLAVGLMKTGEDDLFLPVGINGIRWHRPVEQEIWCHARWIEQEGATRTADLILFDEAGTVVGEIDGLRVQRITQSALRRLSGQGTTRLLHEMRWEPFRLPSGDQAVRHWLLINASSDPLTSNIRETLIGRGHEVTVVDLTTGPLESTGDSHFQMCGQEASNWDALFERLTGADSPSDPDGILWTFGDGQNEVGDGVSAGVDEFSPGTRRNCTGLLHLIGKLNAIRPGLECGLQLLTSDGVDADDSGCSAGQAQYWGLGRVVGAEHPEFRCRLIDIRSSEREVPETAGVLADLLLTETRENQLAIRSMKYLVPRMQAVHTTRKPSELDVRSDAAYLITGGLGVLGREAADWLARQGASQIVLVSRRSPDAATNETLDHIRAHGCDVVVHSADMGSRAEAGELFGRFGADLLPLAGVIHAAGVLDDGLLVDQSWTRFSTVLTPKVAGAALLHEFTRTLSLDFFILYSSAASVLGSPGQGNYATANAYLDGLAAQRRAEGLPATSLNWGPWTTGMADDERIVKRLSLQGIAPLETEDAHAAMQQAVTTGLTQSLIIDVDWRKMRTGLGGESPPLLEQLIPARQRSQGGDSEFVNRLKQLQGKAAREFLVSTLQELLQRVLSTPDAPETERPLIEMGLDSLMAVEFSTELQMMLGEQFPVGPTMLFDHPTIDAICDHVLELLASEGESSEPGTDTESATVQDSAATLREREPVAVVGLSCRFPGAQNVDEFWENLLNGVDAVGSIPGDRWDVDRFYSQDREPGKMYSREGGFLHDISEFDAAFFNISDQEACWIDPQHRMLLENSYRALEDAGIPSHPIADPNVGVFMGIMGQDYAFLPRLDDTEIVRAFEGAGLSHSAGVGRISYVFGFEGPSVAVDTASSSSLVAVHQAVRSLQDGVCNMALAGGVNAILAPVNSLLMSKAGLLAPDGRCKSFSAQADGFGRGEGCGVVVLKRLSDAQRDGDRIMAVVRGGAVVHNGTSSGITSPSGKSQSRVISAALRDAELAPSQVQYLEAHGTGTEFGDPMELGAAASVYGKGRQRDAPLLVGSVKANISHLEAAGGISGLIKTILSLHHGVIPPQIHFEEPSPHIPWNRLPLKIVTERTDWPDTSERVAGVTALGLVGTNAHLIVSRPVENEDADDTGEMAPAPERPRQLLVLSARTPDTLRDLADQYRVWLTSHPEALLQDVCHTSAVGRRHFDHRLAVTAQTLDGAVNELIEFGASEPSAEQSPDGTRSDNGARPASSGDRKRLAWLFGADGDNPAAARTLYAVEPDFRELIAEFDERLDTYFPSINQTGYRLRDWLNGQTGENEPGAEVRMFVLQAGVAHLWKTWGIEPDAVGGFGIGQYAAACSAGVLCVKDALTLVVHREQLSGLPPHATSDSAGKAVAELSSDSQDRFEAFADTLNYYPPGTPLVCGLSGEIVPVHQSLGGSYWRRHLTSAPMIAEGLNTLANTNCGTLLEVGYGCWLDSVDVSSLQSLIPLNSLAADRDVTESLLTTLGELYRCGFNPNFAALGRHWQRSRLGLPVHPFRKRRYWITEVAKHMSAPEAISQ